MKQNIAVGIDIGTFYTRVVVSEKSENTEEQAIILGYGIAESKGIHKGYIVNHAEALTCLKKAVNEAEKQSGHRIKSAALSIGGVGLSSEYATGSTLVAKADNIINKLDIDKCINEAESKIEIKNKVILRAIPVLFKVDGKEIPGRPEGVHGIKLEIKVLFITCFQQHFDDFLYLLEEANIKVTDVLTSSMVSEKLLLSDLQKNYGCALINIGSETVTVSVYENNILTALNVFGIGSSDITKDLALGLRITPEEAENVKIGAINFQNISKRKLEEIIEARLSDIFELIDKYFKKIGRSGLLPSGVILIGGGSYTNMIENVAKNMLKIPVRLGYLSLPINSTKNPDSKPSRDQRLLIAYSLTHYILTRDNEKNSRTSYRDDGDSFWSVIKNFIKQLMP